MSIFANMVPMVAFWYPIEGSEQTYGISEWETVEIKEGKFSTMLIVRNRGKVKFAIPLMDSVNLQEGKKPLLITAVVLRKYGYARDEKGNLIKKPSEDKETVVRISKVEY